MPRKGVGQGSDETPLALCSRYKASTSTLAGPDKGAEIKEEEKETADKMEKTQHSHRSEIHYGCIMFCLGHNQAGLEISISFPISEHFMASEQQKIRRVA